MIHSHFHEIDGNYKYRENFWCVFSKANKLIGLTTYGITYKSLDTTLDKLNSKGCKIIVCTCLSSGDTVELIENKPGYVSKFIRLDAISNNGGFGSASNLLDEINRNT